MAWNTKQAQNAITLLSVAAHEDKLCVAVCKSKATGEPVNVVCVVNHSEDGKSFELFPVAKFFDGNPYDEVSAPELERDGTET